MLTHPWINRKPSTGFNSHSRELHLDRMTWWQHQILLPRDNAPASSYHLQLHKKQGTASRKRNCGNRVKVSGFKAANPFHCYLNSSFMRDCLWCLWPFWKGKQRASLDLASNIHLRGDAIFPVVVNANSPKKLHQEKVNEEVCPLLLKNTIFQLPKFFFTILLLYSAEASRNTVMNLKGRILRRVTGRMLLLVWLCPSAIFVRAHSTYGSFYSFGMS